MSINHVFYKTILYRLEISIELIGNHCNARLISYKLLLISEFNLKVIIERSNQNQKYLLPLNKFTI